MRQINTIYKIHANCIVCNADKKTLDEKITANCTICKQEF